MSLLQSVNIEKYLSYDTFVLLLQQECLNNYEELKKYFGLNRDLNPGPPAPEAGIIPLDH